MFNAVSLLLVMHIMMPQWRMALPDYVYEREFPSSAYVSITSHTDMSSYAGTIIDRMKPFCQRWSPSDAANRTLRPFDLWYTHHPSWIVTNETDEMFCVGPGDRAKPQIRNRMKFYTNQFYSSCGKILVRPMWSSGWGADWKNIQASLVKAMEDGIPLIMKAKRPWHYAANKNDSSAKTCSAGDTTCYFLPYHGCGSLDELENSTNVTIVDPMVELNRGSISREIGSGAYSFMSRKQLWLRRAVFDYKKQFKSKYAEQEEETDCTVIHVRRSDVVLHLKATRRYYPVADYVKLIPDEKRKNPIFLLTDDSNAIEEALEFFPDLRWRYFDRPRHKGSSGGWENQTPSRNPAQEVIVLLATFELAQECSTIVHGHSNFAEYIWQHMSLSDQQHNLERFRVDEGEGRKIRDPSHNASEAEIEKMLESMRQNRTTSSQIKH